MIQSY